jgi:rare lipoprotein A (peptidoglycan hydrolase)
MRTFWTAFIIALAGALVVAPIPLSASAANSCSDGERGPVYTQTGFASWYAPWSLTRRTASGDQTSRYAFTAAHRSLPLGIVVRVINLENCRAITVVVNDRGPYERRGHRILDISKPAAHALGIEKQGVVRVRLEEYPE